MTDLDGCVALLTGADCGDGANIVRALTTRGARVCAAGRHEQRLAAAVAAAEPAGLAVAAVGRPLDLKHRRNTLERTIETFGGIDLLVNCPGIDPGCGPVLDLDERLGANLFAANVLAPAAWTRIVYQGWMNRRGGTVFNLVTAPAGAHGWAAAAAAALRRVSADLSVELGPQVRVRAVASPEELESAQVMGFRARRADSYADAAATLVL